MTLNGKEILAIDVPENAFDMKIQKNELVGWKPTGGMYWYRELPEGQWQILGIAGQLDESVCRGLVESVTSNGTDLYYRDYLGKCSMREVDLKKTPKESWQSFMKSENIPQNYLILVKQ